MSQEKYTLKRKSNILATNSLKSRIFTLPTVLPTPF